MAEAIIAGALKNIEHIAVFDRLAETRFNLIDAGMILTNLFDTVDASLLDVLASQMDMLGYNGWILAETDQEKRELLKGAVSLKKIMGTPGGIREVVQRLGFLDIEIVEGWGNFNDDTPEPDEAPWAYFKVTYVLPNSKGISEEIAENLIGLINHYKNARSKLSSFGFKTPQGDVGGFKGEVTLRIINASDDTLISQEVISNWIHPRKINMLFDGFRNVTAGDKDAVGESRIKFISFGTNGVDQKPTISSPDFTITAPFKKDLDNTPVPEQVGFPGYSKSVTLIGGSVYDLAYVRHYFSLAASEANGKDIKELGLIIEKGPRTGNASPEEHFLCRVVRSSLLKTSAIRIEGTWDLKFYPNYAPE